MSDRIEMVIPVDLALLIQRGRELLYIDPTRRPKPKNYQSVTQETPRAR